MTTSKFYKAPDFLKEAQEQMEDRAVQRDTPEGERSMESTIKAFNALTGHSLTESEGWEFMVLLKLVRGRQGSFRADDYVDAAAYSSLLGESKQKEGSVEVDVVREPLLIENTNPLHILLERGIRDSRAKCYKLSKNLKEWIDSVYNDKFGDETIYVKDNSGSSEVKVRIEDVYLLLDVQNGVEYIKVPYSLMEKMSSNGD